MKFFKTLLSCVLALSVVFGVLYCPAGVQAETAEETVIAGVSDYSEYLDSHYGKAQPILSLTALAENASAHGGAVIADSDEGKA